MRETVPADVARDDLFSAARPFLEHAVETLPALAVPGVGATILLQSDPLVVRLILEGPATACEGLRLVGPEVPGADELLGAVEQFVAAGLSALPSEVIAGIFDHAAKPGGGLLVLLDLAHGAAECLLAVSRCDLSRAVRLFSVSGRGAKPAGPPATETVH